ncbi:MAG: chemotaxis protein CheW [bacterium]
MNDQSILEVVVFNLADERYAVEIAYVREVHPVTELTPLPCAPSFVAGIMNVRGDIFAVIDLRVFLDLPAGAAAPPDHVIIVESADSAFGILTDAATEMASFPLPALEESQPAKAGIRGFLVQGVANGRLIVLDIPGISSDKRFLVHDPVVERDFNAVAE